MRRIGLILAAISIPLVAVGQQQDEWGDWGEDEWEDSADAGLEWTGFVEGALGTRFEDDPHLRSRQTLGDARVRVETGWVGETLTIDVKGDAWYDTYLDEADGEIRELTLSFSPTSIVDLKLGRQVLTWGTGDLLFLNDLFPKDWVSFFAGRDTEYLKAPSNAVRATWYTEALNIDLAWTPVFDPDEYISGERFSFFSPLAGAIVAPMPPLAAIEPDDFATDGEVAIRAFKTVASVEYALYGYHGYFHQPTALTQSLEATFAPLASLGASLRLPIASGLFNAEASWYASTDDRSGTNPLVPNDQARLLLGYDREAVANLTVGFQYYVEWTQDHDELIANSPAPQFEPDEFRHVITNRVTYRLDQDKLTMSLFTFWSPSDRDFYFRPGIAYRYSDQWSFAGGMNLFGGDRIHTFFNQFSDSNNVYVRVRYHY